jgi:hypothetical protein
LTRERVPLRLAGVDHHACLTCLPQGDSEIARLAGLAKSGAGQVKALSHSALDDHRRVSPRVSRTRRGLDQAGKQDAVARDRGRQVGVFLNLLVDGHGIGECPSPSDSLDRGQYLRMPGTLEVIGFDEVQQVVMRGRIGQDSSEQRALCVDAVTAHRGIQASGDSHTPCDRIAGSRLEAQPEPRSRV